MKQLFTFKPCRVLTDAVAALSENQPALTPPIQVLIADDHPRSRLGLRALLATLPQVNVIGEAINGQEAVSLAESSHPDVIIMDAHMPEMDGLEATRRIKHCCPQIRIIMLSAYNNYRAEASAAGADGFLAKGCPIEALWAAILGKPESELQ